MPITRVIGSPLELERLFVCPRYYSQDKLNSFWGRGLTKFVR